MNVDTVVDPDLAELEQARDYLVRSIAQLDRAIDRRRGAPPAIDRTDDDAVELLDLRRLETLADDVSLAVAKEAAQAFAAGSADRVAQLERAWRAEDDATFTRRLAELWSASQMFGAPPLARWGLVAQGAAATTAAEIGALHVLAARTSIALERWALSSS